MSYSGTRANAHSEAAVRVPLEQIGIAYYGTSAIENAEIRVTTDHIGILLFRKCCYGSCKPMIMSIIVQILTNNNEL